MLTKFPILKTRQFLIFIQGYDTHNKEVIS